jgi:hypothetical protein
MTTLTNDKVLHQNINRNGRTLEGTCLDCGDKIHFNTSVMRWLSDETGSMRCSAWLEDN